MEINKKSFEPAAVYFLHTLFFVVVRILLLYMPITIAQFRASLGKLAEGLSDAEVQTRLDFAYRFADGFYDWFSERKGTGTEAITGMYASDAASDALRDEERMKATIKDLYLLPQANQELMEGMIQLAKENEKNPHN